MTSAVDFVMRGLMDALDGCIMHYSRRTQIAQRAFGRILKKELCLEEDLCVCGDLTKGTDAVGALKLLAVRSAERKIGGNYLTLAELIALRGKVDEAYAHALRYVEAAGKSYSGVVVQLG